MKNATGVQTAEAHTLVLWVPETKHLSERNKVEQTRSLKGEVPGPCFQKTRSAGHGSSGNMNVLPCPEMRTVPSVCSSRRRERIAVSIELVFSINEMQRFPFPAK